jgi:hypothetical protein
MLPIRCPICLLPVTEADDSFLEPCYHGFCYEVRASLVLVTGCQLCPEGA